MAKRNLKYLEELIFQAVQAAGFEVNPDDIHVEQTSTLSHGHFATNIALLLAGKLGKNPREVAQKIADHISDPAIQKKEVAGPGFINLFIEQKFYTKEAQALISSTEKYIAESLDAPKKTMVIEYSSPNIAKPFGVHHLQTTIIGESLKRIYRAYGYKVIAENYPGDIGTQFGKLMVAIEKWGNDKKIEANPIDELLALYVRFHKEAEKEPELEDQAREEYRLFEEGDKERRKLWKKIIDWTMHEIQPLYDRLQVSFDGIHGESFFEKRMWEILKKGREQGIFVDGEKGSWIVLPENPDDPPALVRKSDGTTLYLTRDLAQMKFFEEEYHPDIMAWVVDVAQTLHFKQRFFTAKKMNLSPAKFVHVVFGRMDFKDQGMSTRKGNIIKMAELLNEAEERALKLVQQKTEGLTPKEREALSKLMGVGAIKYNILSQNRIHNITFDWDTMLSFEGNSAPYLMYTATRAQSVLRKGEIKEKDLLKMSLHFTDDLETQVMIDLLMYPTALRRAAEEYKPSSIATFLYTLAQDYNRLYNALPFLQAETPESKETRLLLTGGVLQVMRHGLELLGIAIPEKM